VRILFLHGWHSTPGGLKPSYLAQAGHTILNPALSPDDFEEALAVAQAEYEAGAPDVVVGSSRGGAVALNLRCPGTPLVLVCPAWKSWGQADRLPSSSFVLHSPHDEIIPFDHSRELVEKSAAPSEILISVGADHRMACDDALKALLGACESFAD
jgi:fermentation-respiration switch protein FrsA (DUF1100 family)